MLHAHRGYTWVALAQVFQVTATTLSRFARGRDRAGVRVVNFLISAMNLRWQEGVLEAADEQMPTDIEADDCEICLMDFEATDVVVGCPAVVCYAKMHEECWRNAMRIDSRCPRCRGTASA